jgi:hypothetical protein
MDSNINLNHYLAIMLGLSSFWIKLIYDKINLGRIT